MTLPPITRASANDDQAVIWPITSMKSSMRSAKRCAEAGSATGPDLAVIDRFAVAGPGVELGHVGHVRFVDLLGHRVACHRFGKNLGVGGAQRRHHRIG